MTSKQKNGRKEIKLVNNIQIDKSKAQVDSKIDNRKEDIKIDNN